MSINHVKNLTMGQTTDTTLVGPNDWNSNHSQMYTLNGNTTGVSTVGGTDVQFSGGNNVTLSGNGNILGISAGGARNNVIIPTEGSAILGTAFQNSSLIMLPLNDNFGAVVDRVKHFVSFSLGHSTNSTTVTLLLTVNAGLYSKNASTLSLASSGSTLYSLTMASSSSTAAMSGLKEITCPLAATIDGQYWLGFNIVSAGASLTASQLVISQTTLQFNGPIGQAAATSNQIVLGSGTAPNTAALPLSVGFSQISGQSVFRSTPYLVLQNGTA